MFDESGFETSDVSLWYVCYDKIKGCNVILDYLDDMKEGDEGRKEHIRGEAYALRGFYYLMLTNFFGMPYNYGNPEEHTAVPIKLYSGVTTDYDELRRASVADCYRQIERDLREGARLMYEHRESQSTKLTRLNYLAAYALLSRMHLYTEDYDSVLAYADSVLQYKDELLDLKANESVSVYYTKAPVEILWTMSQYLPLASVTGDPKPYLASDEFLGLYKADIEEEILDLRCAYTPALVAMPLATWVRKGTKYLTLNGVTQRIPFPAVIIKGSYLNNDVNTGGIRTAEMYLNRAEVYCRRYVVSGNVSDAQRAIDDLNELREHRFRAGYVNKELNDFATAEELLAFCLRERRRELCAEANHRWFDLRRLGMPELKHTYIDPEDGTKTEYVLFEKSPMYQLPIPEEVVRRNPSLGK